MDAWDGWEVARVVVLFSALMYAGIWMQLTMFHWAAAFRRWEMYGPVLATPLIIVGILLGVLEREGVLGWIALAALSVGVVEGLVGLFFHMQGVVAQVGGLTVRNLVAGPPPVLPLAYALVGVLGLIGTLWDA